MIELVNCLKKRSEGSFDKFLDVLHDTDNRFVADKLEQSMPPPDSRQSKVPRSSHRLLVWLLFNLFCPPDDWRTLINIGIRASVKSSTKDWILCRKMDLKLRELHDYYIITHFIKRCNMMIEYRSMALRRYEWNTCSQCSYAVAVSRELARIPFAIGA